MNPGGEGARYGPMTRCHFKRGESPGDEDGPRVFWSQNGVEVFPCNFMQ